jgi:D-tagatose-1,6-bisphosphate aldolase subunit GatZ/KbaZ
MKALLDRVREHKAGQRVGIWSLCSAHPVVIEAALREAKASGGQVLIEATSNQVNQFGGYTGMKPADFCAYVGTIAAKAGLATDQILLGGDHLGPNCWQDQDSAQAMEHSRQLIADYVAAGFRKIHLDCSMSCADDPRPLSERLVSERAATLCDVAERSWREAGGEPPVYIIGTEVPVPGGAAEDLETLAVTSPAAAAVTLEAHRSAFASRGLQDAWSRVIGMVVQPGVEFDHHKVIDYVPQRAQALKQWIEAQPTLVFEAHSTDYQVPAMLRALVQDHFAILKVGPAATFALREVLWAFDDIAREVHGGKAVQLKQTVLKVMRENPAHWRSYYTDRSRVEFDMQYSLSDRIRYYWSVPEVRSTCDALLRSLGGAALPLTLLSQYLPNQYAAIRAQRFENSARAILLDGIAHVLRGYARACGPVA